MQTYTCTTRADTANISQFCCSQISGGNYIEEQKSCTFQAATVDAYQICVDHYEDAHAWRCMAADGSRCEGQLEVRVCTGGAGVNMNSNSASGVQSAGVRAAPRGKMGVLFLLMLALW